jgi:diaminohydroxyphosphoribosylaminopyrimidine deaminase/5-amino-6-(5-phosphoribosylamino)uracil reductase
MTQERVTPAISDEVWMGRALRLAARGRGWTSPNPMVGAVVVKRGRIVGEGYHHEVGGPHAEIWALDEAGAAARGATVYVSLEPCCHHGRTPPCTRALIAAGVTRVVAASLDPDKRVSGEGVRQLRGAGIRVDTGVREAEARRLNEGFFKRVATGLPFVSLKAAMSLDGKIATAGGESQWITGERARRFAHGLRAEHDAIMVGIETALADDPQLTMRTGRGRNPLRVVVDSRARTPATARLLTSDERRPIVAVTEAAPEGKRRRLEAAGAAVWISPSVNGRVDLCWLLGRLAKEGVNSLLVEGGGTLAAGALAAGVVDRVYFFVAPLILGGASALTPVEGEGARRLAVAWRVQAMRVRRVGEDLLIIGEVSGNAAACSQESSRK